jgi:hypothetical protein
LVAAAVWFGCALPASAQSSSQGPPLGDVARALRAQKKADLPVITNDNFSHLPQLLRETEQRALAAGLVAAPLPVKPSAPEITCSLAFSAQAASQTTAASSAPQDLPAGALAKLDGPAVISGTTLQLSIYNGSSWDVREITVGLTIVRHAAQTVAANSPRLMPASAGGGPEPVLKKPDQTLLYHLKGSAAPLSTTAFKQTLDLSLGPYDEWHWAILQARGVPPASPAQ